jgi:hypothetical protein
MHLLVHPVVVDAGKRLFEPGEKIPLRLIDSTTFAPTLRMAPRPKRTSPATAVKSPDDSFTSGASTRMPMRRHSLR